jgi:hypothetical protein
MSAHDSPIARHTEDQRITGLRASYEIVTARAGSTSVQTRIPGDAASSAVGNAVYLTAGEARFVSSFPPDRKAWAFRTSADNIR